MGVFCAAVGIVTACILVGVWTEFVTFLDTLEERDTDE